MLLAVVFAIMMYVLNRGLKWFTTLSTTNDEALMKGGIKVDFAADARAQEENQYENLIASGYWRNNKRNERLDLIIDLAYA